MWDLVLGRGAECGVEGMGARASQSHSEPGAWWKCRKMSLGRHRGKLWWDLHARLRNADLIW